jgi:hypothetical protein
MWLASVLETTYMKDRKGYGRATSELMDLKEICCEDGS